MISVRHALRVLDPLLGRPLIGLARLRAGGVVLLYHRVSAEDGPDSPPLHPETFREHLDLLTGLFDVLPLAEFVARLSARRSLRACCALTFDDGYADFLTGALPALVAKGLPGHAFPRGRLGPNRATSMEREARQAVSTRYISKEGAPFGNLLNASAGHPGAAVMRFSLSGRVASKTGVTSLPE